MVNAPVAAVAVGVAVDVGVGVGVGVAGGGAAGLKSTVIEKLLFVLAPFSSVTVTSKKYVAAAVGVPEIVPLAEFSPSPSGRKSADIDQV
jgi:hypothetical protein